MDHFHFEHIIRCLPPNFANPLFLVSTVLGIIVSPREIEEMSGGKQGVLWAM